jgi:hypothetical protein
MVRYSISHLGIPIGEVELSPTETAVGELTPASGHDGISHIVRAASEALWARGFLGPGGGDPHFDPAVLSRAQDLSLELHDALGALVPVDFINIVERPGPCEPPVVFVRFRLAHGHVASVLKPYNGDASSRRRS